MNTAETQPALLLAAAAHSVVCLGLAIWLGHRWRRRYPYLRRYTWGYYFGLGWASLILLALIMTLLLFVGPIRPGVPDYLLPVVLGVGGSIGIGVLRRRRWAWIAGTAASLNPLIWVTNAIYLKNRWHEMANPLPDPIPSTRKRLGSWNQGFGLAVKPARAAGNGAVTIEHGRTYQILLTNETRQPSDAILWVDGKQVGGFRIRSNSSLRVTRPLNEEGLFTFFAGGTPEVHAAGLDDAGIQGQIRVTFMPEKRIQRAHPEIRPLKDSSASTDQNAEGSRGFKLFAPARRVTSPGGTGLTGHSDQEFQPVGPIEHVPESKFVRLKLTLRPWVETKAQGPRPITLLARRLRSEFPSTVKGLALIVMVGVLLVWISQSFRWVTRWEVPRIGYLSHGEVIKRGWTDTMIRDLLLEPDKMAPNPVVDNGPLMRLYSEERVEAIEDTPVFDLRQRAAARRSDRVAELLEREKTEAIQAAIDIPEPGARGLIEPIATARTPTEPEIFIRAIPENVREATQQSVSSNPQTNPQNTEK